MLCVSVIWPFSSCRMKVRLPCSTPLLPRCSEAECLPLSRPSPAASTPIRRVFSNGRSEEHTSELQSHLNLVCRLLLEKKKSICFARYCEDADLYVGGAL